MKNYLTYPVKTMNITQNYNGKYSHSDYSKGYPASFPIDEACENSGRNYFYGCCDELVVKRIYGLGSKPANTVWLQSTKKVVTPKFTDYITILVAHMEDEEVRKLKVGKKFKRNAKLFREGKDGFATGNHFHIEICRGKFSSCKNNGWVRNSKGAWVLSGNCYKPEECFYIDADFTKIKDGGGLKFKTLPKEPKGYKVGDIVSFNKIYVSSGSKTGLKPLIKKGKITKIYKGARNPYLINKVLGFINDECITK